jgi:hypothetical protein
MGGLSGITGAADERVGARSYSLIQRILIFPGSERIPGKRSLTWLQRSLSGGSVATQMKEIRPPSNSQLAQAKDVSLRGMRRNTSPRKRVFSR